MAIRSTKTMASHQVHEEYSAGRVGLFEDVCYRHTAGYVVTVVGPVPLGTGPIHKRITDKRRESSTKWPGNTR